MTGSKPVFDGVARIVRLLATLYRSADQSKDAREFSILRDKMSRTKLDRRDTVYSCHGDGSWFSKEVS